ncbi:hypothetical protein A9G48_04030 [Gilliamella sp. wkB18]|uniref:integrating conjugative element protein n=1 Tax=Gilliamella sp. wkB18 TaxID=3120260 RepID=UPI00080E655B|nr:integrating conjugative element protein [Gilliamella apicola]OCG64101.1 hypothetical protein A9G48_04030 [Gilliamella apicola]
MKLLNRILTLSVFVISMSTICTTNAELNVVSDYGGNSMGGYYDMLDPQDEYSEQKQQFLAPENMRIDEGTYLPVHSDRLSPARFESYQIDYPTLQPFIIIGYDELSIEWLKARYDDLEAMPSLVGVAVNIDDINQLNTLKSLTHIPLYAMPGNDLADRFSIHHYPALVTATGVEQ